MPQALVITLMGVGMYAGFRLAKALSKPGLRASSTRQKTSRSDSDGSKQAVRDMGTLRQDPSTGVYRTGR